MRCTLALVEAGHKAAAGVAWLERILERRSGLEVITRQLATYQGLFDAVDGGSCDVAWCPPLVALELQRCSAAHFLAAPTRDNGSSYYSALVVAASSPHRCVDQLRGATIGWIAPQSSAGYLVPRLYLESLGIDADGFFGRSTFLGSHGVAAAALADGDVDAIATHATYDRRAREFVPRALEVPYRILAAAGPIPADLILARHGLSADVRRAVVRALLGMSRDELAPLELLMNVRAFSLVAASHLDPLKRLVHRATSTALRPVHAFVVGQTRPPPPLAR